MIKKKEIFKVVLKDLVVVSIILSLAIGLSFVFAGCLNDNKYKLNGDLEVFSESSSAISIRTIHTQMLLSGGTSASGVVKRVEVSGIDLTGFDYDFVWSTNWANGNTFGSGKNISDYVTVASVSENNRQADINCKKLFEGDVRLSVTSESLSFGASAIVRYVGVPTSLNVTCNNVFATNGTVNYINPNNNLSINYVLANGIGAISSTYKSINPKLTVSGIGTVSYKVFRRKKDSSSVNYWKTLSNYKMSYLADHLKSGGAYSLGLSVGNGLISGTLPAMNALGCLNSSLSRAVIDEGSPVGYDTDLYVYSTVIESINGYFQIEIDYEFEGVSLFKKYVNFVPLFEVQVMNVGDIAF